MISSNSAKRDASLTRVSRATIAETFIVGTLTTDPGETETRIERARVSCEQRGARFTPLRVTVLRLLLQQQRFQTAYELLDRVHEVRPSAQPMTIYRVLEFLIAQGLAHRLDTVNGYVACRSVSENGYCVFAICRRCGKVSEIDVAAVREVLSQQVARAGFTLYQDGTEIRVICETCPQ